MRLRRLLGVAFCLAATAGNLQAAPAAEGCQTGPQLRFPVPAALMDEAHELVSLLAPAPEDRPERPMRPLYREMQILALEKLRLMSPEQRDVVLLSALYEFTLPPHPHPVVALTTEVDERFLEQFLDSLNRRDMSEQSGPILVALVTFLTDAEGGTTGPDTAAERKQFLLGKGPTQPEPGLRNALNTFDDRFAASAPMLMAKAGEIVAADPQLSKQSQSGADDVSPAIYAQWALTEILRCAGDWQTMPEQVDPFADMVPLMRDLGLIRIYTAEVTDGGVAQYILSRAGDFAPAVHEAMLRWNLTDPAENLAAAMELVGQPYPMDRTARIAAWNASKDAADPVFREDQNALDLYPLWNPDFAQDIHDRLKPQP